MENLAELEELLKFFPVYKRLSEIAEAKLLAAAEKGYELQHHKVTAGRKSREWGVAEDQLRATFGTGIYDKPKLLSVPQAEKFFDKKLVAEHTNTVEGGLKLVPKASILQEISLTASEFEE